MVVWNPDALKPIPAGFGVSGLVVVRL